MDTSSRPTPSRFRGTILTLLGVLAALAVVAVAARGETPVGRAGTRRPADVLLDTLLSLFLLLMLAGVVLFVYLLFLRKEALAHYRSTGTRQRSTVRSLLILGAFLVAVFLVVRIRADNGTVIRIPTIEQPPGGGDTTGNGSGSDRYEPEFAWIPILIVGVLALSGIAAASWSAKVGKRARGGNELSLAEALSDVIAESLDDLRAEQDPRLAVIRAYARLERALAAYGLPRRPAEAPLEYLARMLEELSVSRIAVRRLTLLFERAKFSQHAVETEMKESAIAALQQVQEELRAAELEAELERAAAVEAARERAAL
ncbi:MAG TPA: DUF4129 domain-containing protein [Gaiellaceae bacterium]|nr:DUF4129 domain-containing protein [Gaiellaceae bacterium]